MALQLICRSSVTRQSSPTAFVGIGQRESRGKVTARSVEVYWNRNASGAAAGGGTSHETPRCVEATAPRAKLRVPRMIGEKPAAHAAFAEIYMRFSCPFSALPDFTGSVEV